MGSSLRLQRLLQDVARLRQRSFARIHQEKHAIHHFQRALDFSAEIAVAGSVHDIDFRVVIKERRVFRQDGDAAFALEIVRVHHALHDDLIVAEDAALVEHGVHQRGFSVVHVCDDGDIANLRHGILAFSSIVVSVPGCGLDLKPAGVSHENKKGLQVRPCSPHVSFQEELQVHPKCQEYHDRSLRATDAKGRGSGR